MRILTTPGRVKHFAKYVYYYQILNTIKVGVESN